MTIVSNGCQGAPALAAFLLPEAAAVPAWPCGSATDVVSAINTATQGADGLSLLHRAVRSGSVAMVDGLLSFGCSQGFCWRVRPHISFHASRQAREYVGFGMMKRHSAGFGAGVAAVVFNRCSKRCHAKP